MATPTSKDSQEDQALHGSNALPAMKVHRADRRLPPRAVARTASSYRTPRESSPAADLSGLNLLQDEASAERGTLLLLLLNISVWGVDLAFVVGVIGR